MNEIVAPEAICVQCFARFPISWQEDAWIRDSDGVRVLCPDCWHVATGVDDYTEGNGERGTEI